ncbi:MAG: hypothetical protein CMJ48_09370 [Planctomycetaceae bacterium]|jgi:xanthine/CO dehydrogenase XdhC/CoxF family maturation factor|nr:hypothetical protein [Planctomycetaceae bacterium]
MLAAICAQPCVGRAEVTIAQIEREAAEIVRVYSGLRQIVNSRAADECCKEMITQLVVPIWQDRDRVSRRELARQLVAVHESLTYEFQVRAARKAELKQLFPHFKDEIVSDLVPLPRGYQR